MRPSGRGEWRNEVNKISGDVEIVPRVTPAGVRGWEARIDVVFRSAEGQSLTGSQPVRPGCTFGSPREAMDAALLHGQRLLREWVIGVAPNPGAKAAT
ncbi:putative nuclease of the RNAse H fold, HicB family [Ralstonia mannitolilytica]|nr:hypothetical protein R76706_02783 [Ralstonia mannitolilytica]CAJ0801286.1 hypothetical protein R77555_03625 [Ralstonia mannitolilytica]